VNFLLHRHLASRDLGAVAGTGAMLPDLWRMADRRVRPAPAPVASTAGSELAALLAGIDHHLRADRWFHGAPIFVEGEQLTADRLRASGLGAPKLGLFAHVAWELCLDGALLRREGLGRILVALRDGFEAISTASAGAAAALHHFDRVDRTAAERAAFDAGMRRLFDEIARGPWVEGYQHGGGVAQRIEGMRLRLGLGRFDVSERARLGDVFETLAADADGAIATLLTARNDPL
jgi:hypothetical protein